MTPSGVPDPHNPDVDPNQVLCYVCETDVTEKKASEGKKEKDKVRPGLVEIKSEGTGF